MRDTITTVASLSHTVTTTTTQLATMSAALSEATETATSAFRLVSKALPKIDGHGAKLCVLTKDVSRLHSDIVKLCESVKTFGTHHAL